MYGSVHYRVMPLFQGENTATCLPTCMRMLGRFRRSVGRSVNARMNAIINDPPTPEGQAIYDTFVRRLAGHGVDTDALDAHSFGLSKIPVTSYEQRNGIALGAQLGIDRILEILKTRGPFIYSKPGHVVVINGCRNLAPEINQSVTLIDPGIGARTTRTDITLNYSAFLRLYPSDGGPVLVF